MTSWLIRTLFQEDFQLWESVSQSPGPSPEGAWAPERLTLPLSLASAALPLHAGLQEEVAGPRGWVEWALELHPTDAPKALKKLLVSCFC